MKKSKVFFTVTCILCLSSLIAWPQESTNIGEQLKDSSPPPITEFISIGKIFWSIVVFLVSYFVIRFQDHFIFFRKKRQISNYLKRYFTGFPDFRLDCGHHFYHSANHKPSF
jgi:magnesium-transporting ATPase (P-type)